MEKYNAVQTMFSTVIACFSTGVDVEYKCAILYCTIVSIDAATRERKCRCPRRRSHVAGLQSSAGEYRTNCCAVDSLYFDNHFQHLK